MLDKVSDENFHANISRTRAQKTPSMNTKLLLVGNGAVETDHELHRIFHRNQPFFKGQQFNIHPKIF